MLLGEDGNGFFQSVCGGAVSGERECLEFEVKEPPMLDYAIREYSFYALFMLQDILLYTEL